MTDRELMQQALEARAKHMTRDDINRLIQDNGLFHGTVKIGVIMDINHLEKFAALVAAAEREACAKLCEEPGWNAANWCAKQIRARGEKK